MSIQIYTRLRSYYTVVQDDNSIMLKFIAIALLLGTSAAAPSSLYLTRIGLPESPASSIHAARVAPLAYIPAPLTYAEPATLTKYESISSPLTYTASHQPAVALTNSYPLGFAGYPIRYDGLGFAY